MQSYILSIRKSWALVTLLFLTLMYSLITEAAPRKLGEQALDHIIAVVNDAVITQTELNQAVQITKSQFAAQNITVPPPRILRKQTLQSLINKKLQLETATLTGIHVDDHELNQAVAQIAQDNHLSIQEFYARIGQEGFTSSDYRKQIRESLVLQHLQQREVASHITVSPEEITDALRTTHLETVGEKEYHVQDILIPVSDSPSPQELAIAKKFAHDIITQLDKGKQLNQLSSAETETLQTNDLSWRKLTEVPTAFTDVVTHMKVHHYSGPIQTSNGFHIIQLMGERSLAAHTPKPQQQEIAQAIFQRKFEEAMQGWLAKIRSQAFIKIYDQALA